MDYKIEAKPAFNIVGKALRVATAHGENMRKIPLFWDECMHDGTLKTLTNIASHDGVLGDVVLGVCADFAPDMSMFTYLVAAEAPKDGAPADGMSAVAVPPLTWAIFESVGPMPDAIQAVWSKIWSEFFSEGKYEHDNGPDLELYHPGDPKSGDYRFEVWVPVRAKT